MPSLVQQIMEVLPQDNALRVGVVASVDSGTATVTIDGVDRAFPRLASYTATAGDVVLLLRNKGDWIIIGKIVGI